MQASHRCASSSSASKDVHSKFDKDEQGDRFQPKYHGLREPKWHDRHYCHCGGNTEVLISFGGGPSNVAMSTVKDKYSFKIKHGLSHLQLSHTCFSKIPEFPSLHCQTFNQTLRFLLAKMQKREGHMQKKKKKPEIFYSAS